MARILLVLSGADHWTLADGSKHPTGFWAEEFVAPHQTLRAAGHEVVVATPGGVTPTVDQTSLAPAAVGGVEKAHTLAAYLAANSRALQVPVVLEEQDAQPYEAIYLVGGHGAMEDLAESHALGGLLEQAVAMDRLVVAICHGVAGLIPAGRPDGTWLFSGRRLTGFTDEEERIGGLAGVASWLLETRLRELGADLVDGAAWAPHVVVDGSLVTGQNPASSEQTAQVVLDLLNG